MVIHVPQIMCPHCGRTITLENRRRLDFDMIVTAVKNEPKNFTQLLGITKLSRKTLSLRLKEMCENEVIVKKDGKYNLNGASHFLDSTKRSGERLSRMFHDRRLRMGVMLISLILLSSTSGYTLAKLLEPPQTTQANSNSMVLGNFTLTLNVNDINDLYAWQAVIAYNVTQLGVMETRPGGFIETQFTSRKIEDAPKALFLNTTASEEGTLLLGGCLIGQIPGVSGNGTLATVTFAYYAQHYDEPRLVSTAPYFNTFLLNSNLTDMDIGNSTLTLSLTESY